MEVNNKKLEEAENEKKFQVFTLEEPSNNQDQHNMNWFANEVKHIFGQWKFWVESQKDNEELQLKIAKLKQESDILLKKTTKNVKAFCENEDIKEKFHVGKDKALTTGMNAVHLVSEGIQEALQQEHVKKVVNNIHNSIEQVRNDERVKAHVKKLKKGTLRVAEITFYGVKKILEEKEPENKDTTDHFRS